MTSHEGTKSFESSATKRGVASLFHRGNVLDTTRTLGLRAPVVHDRDILRANVSDRIALVCRSLDGGGAEGVMVALAGELTAMGIDTSLVLLCHGRRPTPRGPFDVVELGAKSTALAALPFVRWLERARPRSVLSTLIAPNALAVSAARMVRHRPRVVVREANTISAALRFRSPASRTAAGLLARATYPRADAIVAVSEGAGDDLARFLGLERERITVIPNPAITHTPRPIDHPWLARPRPVPVIVAAGRLVPKKGFDVLIDAFAQIRSVRSARLVILGDGPERTRLARRLVPDVELHGFVDDPISWFAQADLFVLSSFAEGMPNALLQAMACGCPIVATDCPSGPREILEDGRWGRLVPPGDASALARAILETLEHPIVPLERAAAFRIRTIAKAYQHILL